MSKITVREEKNCLNCSNPNVEERFCPKCGQENVESHQSFKSLAVHFFEDFTHYDNAFWKTIKYLLFHPARLTKEYLDGKRKNFVPPVKLYIFISFVTFLLPSFIPEKDYEDKSEVVEISLTENDTKKKPIFLDLLNKVNSVKELDSIQKSLPQKQKNDIFSYWLVKNELERGKKKEYSVEMMDRMGELYYHSIPKALFLYLPIFGFWLWLFHGKKRWYFYDHSIFTLHYFAFILLTLTLALTVLDRMISFIPSIYDTVSFISGVLSCLWIIIYFFIAHKRMYNESGVVSFFKSGLLFFINTICFSALMLWFLYYAWINVK